MRSQKEMLEEYARRNGFPNPTHFTDDGISGTRFDRPGFVAMMEEVEAGRVEPGGGYAIIFFPAGKEAIFLEAAEKRERTLPASQAGRGRPVAMICM